MEEKMKEISAAYDELKKRINHKSSSNDVNLNSIKEEYIDKIKAYNNLNPNDDTRKAHDQLNLEIFFSSVSINNAQTELEIKNIFENFKGEITKIYINLISEFLTKYLINQDEVTENVCFGVGLENFYQWLLNIKKKYSPLVKIDEIVESFKQYAGYIELESIIDGIVEKVIKDLKVGKITRYAAYSKIAEDIETCFKDFYAIKERINKLKETKNVSLWVIKAIEELELELQGVEDLSTIKSKIKEIEDRILKEEKLKYQIPEMNRIYARVMGKASASLQGLNPDEDNFIFKYINSCILRIMSIFNYVCNNIVDMELIRRLEQITFSDVDFDNTILSSIEENLSGRPIHGNDNKLYVRSKFYDPDDIIYYGSCIYHILSEEKGIYKVVKWTSSDELIIEEISVENLARDFVPLDDYLNDEHLVWKKRSRMDGYYYSLYSFGPDDNSTIVLLKDYLTGQQTLKINDGITYSNVLDIDDSDMEKWKNSEYLKNQLIDHIKYNLEKIKEKNQKKYNQN